MVSTLPFFEYNIFSGSLSQLDLFSNNNRKRIINTINPHSFYIASQDAVFKHALKNSCILLPDGIGIVYGNLILNKKRLSRIAGIDLFEYVLNQYNKNADGQLKKIFFLGSTNNVLAQIKTKIAIEFPTLEIDYYSPPFKAELSETDNQVILKRINTFKPEVLFVGMTAPKQEKWVFMNKEKIDARLICSVGAVFDFYAERIKRPGKVWQALGLEWLGRLLHEPKRLWRRSFISSPYFIGQVIKSYFRNLINAK